MGQEAQNSKWKNEQKILPILRWDPIKGYYVQGKGKQKVAPTLHQANQEEKVGGNTNPVTMAGSTVDRRNKVITWEVQNTPSRKLSMKWSGTGSVPTAGTY